jgi:hypothetical protein
MEKQSVNTLDGGIPEQLESIFRRELVRCRSLT